MPGNAMFRLPTEIASEATTKKPASRHRHHRIPDQARHRKRYLNPPEALPRGKAKSAARFVEVIWNGAQRLEKTERHIPGLAGEDCKNRCKFGSQRPVRRQANEEHHGEGKISKHRDGLENIEEWDEQHFCAAALGSQRAVGECEDERCRERQQHPQGRPQRVVRQ